LFSIITNLLHYGLTIVGLDYGYAGQMGVKEVHGNSPYGASTIADGDGSRQPSQVDLDGAATRVAASPKSRRSLPPELIGRSRGRLLGLAPPPRLPYGHFGHRGGGRCSG